MMGVAEVMVLEYNGRKKAASNHRLLIRKLYEKPKRDKEPDSIDLFDDEELLVDTAGATDSDEEEIEF